jgi:hypothetical protein
MHNIDSILDNINSLDLSDKQMLYDILEKRKIEEQRDIIAKNAKQAVADFHAGKFKPKSAKEIIADLNKDLENE